MGLWINGKGRDMEKVVDINTKLSRSHKEVKEILEDMFSREVRFPQAIECIRNRKWPLGQPMSDDEVLELTKDLDLNGAFICYPGAFKALWADLRNLFARRCNACERKHRGNLIIEHPGGGGLYCYYGWTRNHPFRAFWCRFWHGPIINR